MLGEILGDGGNILGVRKAVCASPGLGFGLISNKIVDVGKDLLELGTEKLSNEGSREVEGEDLRESST